MTHKKHNPLSTALRILGLSFAISFSLLLSSRLYSNLKKYNPATTSSATESFPNSIGKEYQNTVLFSYAFSRKLFPILTWSIAGALILVVGIAVIRSHRKHSRTAVIAVLYLLSAVLLTKSAAIGYITTHNPASTNNTTNTASTNNTTNATNTTETYIPSLPHHHTTP